MNNIKCLILAGGSGKRLWPLSRKKWPKYMLKIDSDMSLLQLAFNRLEGLSDIGDRYVVTSRDTGFLVERELRKISDKIGTEQVITEPESKNTAPAILMGIRNMEDDDIVVVLPADHIIEPAGDFKRCIQKAAGIADKGYIVTIGIKPGFPATGYGYIKIKPKIKDQRSKMQNMKLVDKFVEKPGEDKAREYFDSGKYFWNAGIFVFKAGVMKAEIKKYNKRLSDSFDKLKTDMSNAEDIYSETEPISIDYSVMEKTDRAAVVTFDGRWNDLGSWESVMEVITEKEKGVYSNTRIKLIDCGSSLFYAHPKKLIAAAGIEDAMVIDTEDALLVVKKGEGQKVKEFVEELEGEPETTYHLTDQRPWGGYRVLSEGEGYKVKILEVEPGHRLSYQKHEYRDEIWTVIDGTATVYLNDDIIELEKGASVTIPAGSLHRAENSGPKTLRILELALGATISEDDIIRVEDDYKR